MQVVRRGYWIFNRSIRERLIAVATPYSCPLTPDSRCRYVQAHIENHAERLFRDVGTLGHQYLQAMLGNNRSQMTIGTSEF